MVKKSSSLKRKPKCSGKRKTPCRKSKKCSWSRQHSRCRRTGSVYKPHTKKSPSKKSKTHHKKSKTHHKKSKTHHKKSKTHHKKSKSRKYKMTDPE
jgi:hypothetical protein